ncbi:hypothetical protein PF005_g27170 [Phytophthora fragariae]|uniref:Crinkler effector protein N-terminal domain-containing protein n=1 Tax=Phytophthora fragariae TaxID=53985 RepID=A0A6A3W0Z3_9STRA|nr:hypothetical protein PF005_g27170 [Phytophthora fragariae]
MINCAVIGQGSVITIIIDDWKTVALLKKAIKDEKSMKIKCDPDGLQLFLTKKDGAWLSDDDALDAMLEREVDTSLFEKMAKAIQALL